MCIAKIKVATLSQLNRKCLFHSQVLEIASIYPVTTIKANVLAIPNQQRTAIRKRSQVPVCVYIKERFPISSRSPQCVLNETFGRYEKKNTTTKLCVFDNEAEHESQSNSISEHTGSPLFIHFLSIHK